MQHRNDHYHALAAGVLLRDYRIEGVLGSGSFGITYKAREEITDRLVAIKEYLPSALSARARDGTTLRPISESARDEFEWGLARFRGEAKVLTSLSHPSIVPALSYFETNGTGYLVMELQIGRSLGERIAGAAALPEDEVLKLVMPLLDGIEAVHAKGFLHRDIKPDNIVIRTDGTPVLLDFGAARQALSAHSGGLTAVLTEGYAPYEQYQRDGNQGPWTDIYALGAVMFRCLLGRVPAVATQRLSAWSRRAPDPIGADLDALRNICAPNVVTVVGAALAVMEQERPQSVAELRRMFVDPASAVRARASDATIMLAGSPRMPAARRRIAAVVAGIAAAVTAGGAAAYFTLFADPSSPARDAALNPASGLERSDRADADRADADRAEAERRRVEEEARRAEEERRRIEAERERRDRERAEDEAKRKAQEEERKRAEDEAKRKAEEEERKRAEDEARRKAEDEARRKAEDEARRKAEDEARSAQSRRAQELVVHARGLIDQARAAMQSARLADARRFYFEAVAAEREAERLNPAAPGLDGARRNLFKLDSELKPLIAARVRTLVAEAKQHTEAGRYDDSQRILREAQRLDPASAEVAQANRDLAAARRAKPPAAAGQPLSRADAPAHARQLYEQIMQWALRQRTQTLQGAAATGAYRTMERHKALAVCIDWPNSSPASIKFGGLGIMQSGSTGNVTRDQALETCASVRPNATCTCTVIDYNDTNVLTFPESYVARHYR